jgi:hypothetical protein
MTYIVYTINPKSRGGGWKVSKQILCINLFLIHFLPIKIKYHGDAQPS